ncbi:hypothetical protein [Novosphingobium sp. 9]|uniref:hypothetical protein n=1 Tax=Novosphingobium sp. 9 TaxID=2025349 RepID=UPI0021B697C4|nr:hypothetical protein [Novosphingobium sp. 9]
MPDNASLPAARATLDTLTEALPDLSRLALVYAPRRVREQTAVLLALDTRMAGLLRHSKEPMLARIRLAWWRESLQADPAGWPEGEPLLASLRQWNGEHLGLTALVDGWEELTGAEPLAAEGMQAMAEGRGAAFAAFARAIGREREADRAHDLGCRWGLTDLAMRLGKPGERDTARTLAEAAIATRRPYVSRDLRPLLVLEALSARRFRAGHDDGARSPAALLQALRLGAFGR